MIDLFNQSTANGELGEVGIGGFNAYVFTDRSVNRTATTPVNYLEDGSFASDHIIINPVSIAINGVVSDTYIKLSPSVADIIQSNSTIENFTNLFDNGKTGAQLQRINDLALTASDTINRIGDYATAAGNVVGMFGNKSNSICDQFVEAMETLVNTKQLITIETRFKAYQNMMITSFSVREDNQTDAVTFALSAQEIRTVTTEYTDISKYAKHPSSKAQAAVNVDKGVQSVDGDDGELESVWTSLNKSF